MSQNPENATANEAHDTAQAAGAETQDLAALQERLETAERAAQEAKDAQLRALADLDNTRRRLEREAQASLKYGAEKLLGELLSVCDSLELGLQAAAGAAEGPTKAMADGMELTYKQLLGVMEKNGVTQINPVSEPFNPDFHQAMSMIESADLAPNHVHSVMQKGYTLHERLLRPAMVMVTKAPSA